MRSRCAPIVWFVVAAVAIALLAVAVQVHALGRVYIEGRQLDRHNEVMKGNAPDPWQYRILSEYAVAAVIAVLRHARVHQAVDFGFVGFRVVQNIVIMVLAGLYFRKWGFRWPVVMTGMATLGWVMSHALFNSDLSLNTYSDVIFFLAAGLLLLHDQEAWLIPLCVVAVASRETALLIALMPLALVPSLRRSTLRTRPVILSGVALLAGGATYLIIRLSYGSRTLAEPNGHTPGINLFLYNVSRQATWRNLLITYSVVPLIALLGYAVWPPLLRRLAWLVIPVWALATIFGAVFAETRLLLVPFALVIIPGMLFAIEPPSPATSQTAGDMPRGPLLR